MSEADLRELRDLARRRTGILLGADKDYFVATRAEAVAAREGLAVGELAARVRRDPDGDLARRTAEALLIHETSFFRDPPAFEALASTVLPSILARREAERSLTIWSAACATGQEPYSVAMLLAERFPALAGWRVRLLASDVSGEALDAARAGLYTHLEANRGLPARMLVRHFEREGFGWRLSTALRDRVELRRLNLLEPLPPLPPVDLVLLRNVLIYFDVPLRREVLRRVREALRPDGWLLLGAAETTVFLDDAFEPAPGAGGFYRLAGAPAPQEGSPCT